MPEPGKPPRPLRCPRCGALLRVVANPYYGVGLAVHRQLSSCTRCDYAGFLRGAARDGAHDRERERAARPSPWRRMRLRGRRLLRLLLSKREGS